jgi:hypothetical protein
MVVVVVVVESGANGRGSSLAVEYKTGLLGESQWICAVNATGEKLSDVRGVAAKLLEARHVS